MLSKFVGTDKTVEIHLKPDKISGGSLLEIIVFEPDDGNIIIPVWRGEHRVTCEAEYEGVLNHLFKWYEADLNHLKNVGVVKDAE